jgi:hypothetical protein
LPIVDNQLRLDPISEGTLWNVWKGKQPQSA